MISIKKSSFFEKEEDSFYDSMSSYLSAFTLERISTLNQPLAETGCRASSGSSLHLLLIRVFVLVFLFRKRCNELCQRKSRLSIMNYFCRNY